MADVRLVELDQRPVPLYFSTVTNDFASVKLRRPFAEWLKQQAAKRRTTMYALVEDLAERGGSRPWDPGRRVRVKVKNMEQR